MDKVWPFPKFPAQNITRLHLVSSGLGKSNYAGPSFTNKGVWLLAPRTHTRFRWKNLPLKVTTPLPPVTPNDDIGSIRQVCLGADDIV